jgi:hypothetical protein
LKVDDLARNVDALAAKGTTRLIAIDGWGGSGRECRDP